MYSDPPVAFAAIPSVPSVFVGCFVFGACSVIYSKTCVKWPLKIDKTKILITNGSLIKVKSIAECSTWSILQYF